MGGKNVAGEILEMGDLSHPELLALNRERTLVLLAVSPVEVHGAHLPLKTDYFLTGAMIRSAAKAVMARLPGWSALVAPALPVGSDVLPLPGSVELRPRVLRDLVADVGSSYAKAGFKWRAVLSGHGGPRHNTAIELGCRDAMKRHKGFRMFSPTSELILYVLLGDFREDLAARLRGLMDENDLASLWPSDVHAGALETSLALCYMPEMVREGWRELPKVCFGEGSSVKRRFVRGFARLLGRSMAALSSSDADRRAWPLFCDNLAESILLWKAPDGPPPLYAGFPALASKELGEAYSAMIAERGAALIEDVVSGRRDLDSTFTILSRSRLLRLSIYA